MWSFRTKTSNQNTKKEPPNSPDLFKLDQTEVVEKSATGASPAGKSAAALEADLEAANKKIAGYNAERFGAALIVIVIWDANIFPNFQGWAPPVSILILELVGLFMLAARLNLGEVVNLMVGALWAYGKRGESDPSK
jgi:hypothetical protein